MAETSRANAMRRGPRTPSGAHSSGPSIAADGSRSSGGSTTPRARGAPPAARAESARPGARATPDGHAGHVDQFRHSYTKDRAVLLRRLSRIEGQVRGIARMIEREDYCVDILQQTAALRAAVDALSVLVLEDHVQGCIRTAAERGEADAYVDEVIDVVRRTLGRPIRGTARG